MVHYSKFAAGMRRYLVEDLVNPLKGTGKAWLVGAVIELVMMRVDELFHGFASIPLINLTGYLKGDEIDVEALYAAVIAQARQGNAIIPIPVVGAREYTVDDVERAYRYIKEA